MCLKLHEEKERFMYKYGQISSMLIHKGVKRASFFAIILLMCLSFVSAATISGTIYDYNLARVKGAVLSINTSPEQILVSELGTYNIILEEGTYKIQVSKAERAGLSAVDSAVFVVQSDGVFTHDFILFEQAEDVEIPNLVDEEKGVGPISFHPVLIIVFIIVVIILAFLAVKAQRHDEVNPPDEDDEMLKEIGFYIKKNKRVSQKEIRLQFHYSESAVSMAITHLENEGYVKKIKSGRANIIVWQGRPKKVLK